MTNPRFVEFLLFVVFWAEMQRPRKRLTELMLQTLEKQTQDAQSEGNKVWELKFLRSPLAFLEDPQNKGSVGSISLAVNKLEDGGERAVATRIEEHLTTTLAIKSVGYSSSCPDNEIPFDAKRGIIENVNGRVNGLPGDFDSNSITPLRESLRLCEYALHACFKSMQEFTAAAG